MARAILRRVSVNIFSGPWLRSCSERACFSTKTDINYPFSLVFQPFKTGFRRVELSTAVVRPIEADGNGSSRIDEEKRVEMKKSRDVLNTVNRMIASPTLGRLFAVVHLGGSQHKITEEDVIVVNKLQAETGSKILLNKVLLAGTKHFTLIGRPLLPKELVTVEATVTEQTRTQRIIVFKKKRRKNYKRKRGHRQDITVLRINSISLQSNLK